MWTFAGSAWQIFWREELPYLLVAAALIALILARALRTGRSALTHTLLFLMLSLAAELAGAMIEAGGAAGAGAIVRETAIVATGLAVIRLAGLALFRAALPAAGVSAPRIVEDVILVLAYLAWGMLRLRLAGMDLASLVTTSAVITAVVAFAMQDTLGNVLGGLFLELDGSLAIGDWIRLDDLSGRVAEIRWRHTTIRTRNGELVIVPNSALMKSRFAVIGNPDKADTRWRRWIWFDVGFDVPPAKVLAAAEQALAAAEVPNVAREPKPSCVLMEFAESYCRYALRYWLRDPQPDDTTDTAVRVHLLAALQRAGIALALPQYVVHRIKEGEARQAALHAHEIATRIAALRGVELFSHLAAPELSALAERLVAAPFAAGDVITRQGAIAHWLYLLVDGEAEVWVDAAGAPRRRVAVLGPGSVFGEMGMMTGEPRSATVTAKTDVECYRLDKAGFEDIIRARPAIAEEISRVLAARASGLRHAVEDAQAEAAAARTRPETLLQRIRAFFGLEEPATRDAA
ncbi:MAG: mechanosensitive ion channel [Betaproteobacteria bacterium]|nr:mechanosensitive ion channel [Betaproteobacteria bacterium]